MAGRKFLNGIDLNNQKAVNQADPTSAQDGATKNYADKIRSFSVTVARSGTADYICDGTADDVQIQAAIDAVHTAGGGVVFLRSGTYRIATTVVVDENVTILGERMARQSSGGVTLKTAASTSLTDMIQVTGTANPSSNADLKHDIQFIGITFDGNNSTTNNVKLTNQDTVKFTDCRFIQSTNSLVTVWDSTAAPTAATIPGGIYMTRCNVSPATSGIGIDLQYQTQCWFTDTWHTPPSGTPTAHFRFKSCNKIFVNGAEFNTAATALLFEDVSTGGAMDYSCYDIHVNAKTFANGGTVIDDNRTHASSGNVKIKGTMSNGTSIGDKLVGSGNLVEVNDNFTPFAVLSQAAADKVLTLKGFASQSGRYLEAQNSSSTAIAYLNSGGNWYVNNGSTSAVSYGFTSEINSGMYRIGAGDIGWSLAGTLSMELSSAGLDVKTRKILNVTDPTSAQDAATKAYVDAHSGGDMVLASAQTNTGAKTFNAGTLLDKGSMVFNVKAFGAVGNDSTDDTSAIQSAIDAAQAAGGGVVWFPNGTYKITSALKLYSGSTPTITAYENIMLAGAGSSGTGGSIIKQYTTGADCIKGLNDVANGAQALNIVIRDLCVLWGTGTASNSGNGIYLAQQGAGGPSFQQFTIQNVVASGFGGSGKYGFNFESLITSKVDTCMAVVCANGFNFNGTAFSDWSTVNTSVSVLNCYANGNTGNGYNVDHSTYMAFNACAADSNGTGFLINSCNSITLTGCGVEYGDPDSASPGDCYKISGGSASVGLYDCYAYQSKHYALWVTGSSYAVTAVGFQENSPVSATASIKVDSGSIVSVIDPSYSTATDVAGTLSYLGDGGGGLKVKEIYGTRITKRVSTTTSSATPTINTDVTDMLRITAQAAAITSFTTNLSGTPTDGQTLWISITDNGTARAITWGSSFEASTVALPTTTVVSTRLDVGFVWNAATSKWRCVAVA